MFIASSERQAEPIEATVSATVRQSLVCHFGQYSGRWAQEMMSIWLGLLRLLAWPYHSQHMAWSMGTFMANARKLYYVLAAMACIQRDSDPPSVLEICVPQGRNAMGC